MSSVAMIITIDECSKHKEISQRLVYIQMYVLYKIIKYFINPLLQRMWEYAASWENVGAHCSDNNSPILLCMQL